MKLPSAYEPAKYEADIYSLWEQNEAFAPVNRGNNGRFSMALPPPNANANLHIGYGLTIAIYDIVARYHRMLGEATLMIPGADHAGFETQSVYEKHLAKEGKSRLDFSREELYSQIWDFVERNKHNFEAQIRALGASCDWTHFTYTLDGKVVAQTYETFKKMWDEGLIYRGKRIVNYCTYHGTSFADIEVVHEEEDTKLWYIVYPLTDGSGEVVVATARPETKMGQAALMVNPKDKRYKDMVGKEVNQPLVPNNPIKIIADDYVDMKFGTGVVTVTPGHDPNDFEVAQRHNLPTVELITPEGKMSQNVPEPFRGLTVSEARQAAETALEKNGFLRKVEPYRHSVGKCYKCGTVIEPLLLEQWFVKMRPLADKAIEALKKDKINFRPAGKKNQLIRYLTEVKDWNISRQIAWGIPIPAFVNQNDPSDWIFDARTDQASIELNGQTYKRDSDVFDTWFSSGQWPYVTLDYPDGPDFKKFYPLSLMDTGDDILYPWVARMIMLGLYVTGDVPFENVYIHGYIRAEDGTKMSKSLGNTVEAMDVVARYGSDAARMGLVVGRVPGVARPFDPRRLEEARNFANKLWNVARYVEEKIGNQFNNDAEIKPTTPADHWILSRAGETARQIAEALENYRLSEAYEALYSFIWGDVADWYIEASKLQSEAPQLAYVLSVALKLAHPFAPFVTEAIWQALNGERESILAVQKWPQVATADPEQARNFQDLIDIISEARRIVAAVDVKKPTLYFRSSPLITQNAELVTRLGRLGAVQESVAPKSSGMRINKVGYDAWLDIDTGAAKAYIDKLIDQKIRRQELVDKLENRLGNAAYVDKAPKEVVEQTRQLLEAEIAQLAQNNTEIDTFSKLAES